MNRILRFIYAALIVSTAVACHTSEIDNPNNDNQDKPKAYDNIILTASIKQTRVDYSINGDKLEQRWAENDVIYGFYGDTKAAKDKKIVFTVNSVDESGVASLSPGDGWSDFLSVYKRGNLKIRLVYTGCTTTELSDLFDANGDILIDMTNQGTDRIPACIHAESYDKRSEGDITYIQFQFDNDCSIIEVFSFTGVKEESGQYFDGASATLGSIAVDGLIERCKYSLGNNGDLQFESIDKSGGDDAPTTVTLGGDWSVTKDGDITYAGNIKPVFIAAVPFDTSRDITVSAKLSGGEDSFFNQTYTGRTFEKGHSYYIMADPVIAKTVDNVYFKTVNDAFKHAEDLNDNDLLEGRTNTVTLLVDEINGLGEQVAEPAYDKPIAIDYDVTLDLNGCTLSLSGSEYFEVTFDFINPVILTITDSTGPDSGGKYDGTISSNSGNSILWNFGTVNIHGGNLIYYGDNHLIQNFGTVNISDGFLKSYAESDEENKEYYSVVYNEATLNIYGGTLNSVDCDTIRNNESGTVTISDGTITSENNRAVTNYGDLTISRGKLSSSAGYVSKDDEGYVAEDSKDYEDQNCRGTIYNWSNLTITDGTIESEYCRALYNSGTTTITGGTIEALDDMAIMNFAELTVGKTPAESNDAISIISGSTYYVSYIPAIYCDGGSLDMYYGTVTCPAGAVILENGSEATISGGYFSSTDYSTVQILDGSQCSISGGVFVSSGFGVGTIAFYGGNATSTLSITWPAGISNPSPDTTHEPLIYSGDTGSATSLPISTFIGQGNKQPAQITIEGGYLISSNNDVNRFLYDASGDNLKVWDTENDEAIFGNFYSNVTNVLLYEKTGAKDHNLTLTTENNQVIYGHSFEAIKQSGDGFAIPVINESTGKLYKIMPK